MNIFSGFEKIVKSDSSLSHYTWFGLGGPADWVISPETVDELSGVVRRCRENGVPFRVLGFGSNLLVSDEGVRGVVIKLDGPLFYEHELRRGDPQRRGGRELEQAGAGVRAARDWAGWSR